ncbi:MAG: lytic transglycosylase domain-containing protein [Vicinamibacterales bacterium]
MRVAVLTLVALAAAVAPARAELVYFTTGRMMKVDTYREDGDRITLVFRGGGEATFSRALIERIDPDEVADPVAAPVAATAPVRPDLAERPYADLIDDIAGTYGVDARLVHAVVAVESNYQARARSPKGAKGLMQLMPGTARQYAVRDPYDPASNLDAGVRHLKDLLSRLDLSLAIAAYNAGEGAVRRYGGIPPFPETRNYVRQVLARVAR